VLSRISYAKNQAQTPEQMRAQAFAPDTRKVADIFAAYEALLKQSNALDFDDLLLRSRGCCGKPRRSANAGRIASSICTWTSIRTRIACNTIYCAS